MTATDDLGAADDDPIVRAHTDDLNAYDSLTRERVLRAWRARRPVPPRATRTTTAASGQTSEHGAAARRRQGRRPAGRYRRRRHPHGRHRAGRGAP